MSDNTEKKILIDVKILDNFVTSKKNIDEAKKSLNDFIKSGEKNDEQQRKLAEGLAKSTNEYRNAKIQIESSAKSQEIMTVASNNALKSMGEMQRELKALRNTPLDPGDPKQVKEVEMAMAELTDQIGDYKAKIKGLDTAKTLSNIAEGAQMLTATTQVLAQGLNGLGIESEVFEKLQSSTVELIGATQALGVVSEYLADKKYLIVAANIAELNSKLKNTIASWFAVTATTAEATAEGVATTAKTGGALATGVLTAATWMYNAALSVLLSPITLIVAAVGLLIFGIVKLSQALDTSAASHENARQANIAYEQQVQKTQNTIDAIEVKRTKQINDATIAGRKEIEQLKQHGATKEQLAVKEYETASKIRNIQIKYSEDFVRAKVNELKALNTNTKAAFDELSHLDKGSNKYNEQVKVINEFIKKKRELAGIINKTTADENSLNQDQVEADRKRQEERTAKAKEQSEKRKAIAEKNAKAEMDLETLKRSTIIQGLKDISSDVSKSYSDRLNALTKSENEQIKLLEKTADFDKKQKGLTAKQILLIDEKLKADKIKLKSETDKAVADLELQNAAKSLEKTKQKLSNEQEAELKALSDKYAKKAKGAKSSSDFMNLEKENEKEAFDIAQKYRNLDFNASVDAMTTQLGIANIVGDQKIAIEKQIADAKTKFASESTAIAIKSNDDIVNSAKEAAEKQKAIDKELSDKKQELYSQLQSTLKSFVDAGFENENTALDEQTQNTKDSYDAKIEAAKGHEAEQKRLETERDAQLKTIDNEKRKRAREQAIIEKAFAAAGIIASTAKSVGEIGMKVAETTAASVLNPLLIPFIPVVAAQIPITYGIGALQLAAIMAAPLPKAERGKVFKGNSHAQGGIPVEVEGDEIIMTKGVYRNPQLRAIASIINQAAGGVGFGGSNANGNVFANGGIVIPSINYALNDGGYAARSATASNGFSQEQLEAAITKAVRSVKVYTTIQDIRREDANYTKVEARGSN